MITEPHQGLGEFLKAKQTWDVIESLHNCLKFSQLSLCLDESVNKEKVLYCLNYFLTQYTEWFGKVVSRSFFNWLLFLDKCLKPFQTTWPQIIIIGISTLLGNLIKRSLTKSTMQHAGEAAWWHGKSSYSGNQWQCDLHQTVWVFKFKDDTFYSWQFGGNPCWRLA